MPDIDNQTSVPRPPLDILFQDDWLVAVNKPSGLLVHRSEIDRHETDFALQWVRDQIGQRVYPVHRLDKPTSGVLLFCLNPDTARRLTTQFQEGAVRKTYLAVVRGYIAEQGTIDYALKEQPDRMTDRRARTDKPAQPAITDYRRLHTVELPYAVGRYPSARYSFIEARPRTGRKHQIRRHLKHVFHPIIGDTTHGDGRHNQLFRDKFDCHRLLLHASQLEFTHPHSEQPVSITAPLDRIFSNIITNLGWR